MLIAGPAIVGYGVYLSFRHDMDFAEAMDVIDEKLKRLKNG